MNYTIATYKEESRGTRMEIFREGDRYGIHLAVDDLSKSSTRYFDNIKDVYNLFCLMSKYTIYGLYATNDRFEIFKNWSGEEKNIIKGRD